MSGANVWGLSPDREKKGRQMRKMTKRWEAIRAEGGCGRALSRHTSARTGRRPPRRSARLSWRHPAGKLFGQDAARCLRPGSVWLTMHATMAEATHANTIEP